MRTRVKICGITRVEDAINATQHGADAIGLVFYGPSPRSIDVTTAARIVASLPPFVSAVGLFVNASAAEISHVLSSVKLHVLQFHGDESPSDCRQYGLPYIKAVSVKDDTNLLQYALDYADAQGLLLDTHVDGQRGGTGQVFDWTRVPANLSLPVVLAGGLNADNVGTAIRQVRPYAVDVSGGVEATKGIKDAAKIAAFMRGVLNESL